MDALSLRVRNHVYQRFVALGRPPSADEVEGELGLERDDVELVLRRLHGAHALVLEPDSVAIRMLNPFSCVPTPHRVQAGGRSWFANCAWDALGIPAALGVDGHVSSSCPDCGEAIQIEVRGRRAVPDSVPVHLQVPAARWWDDIVFT